MRKFLLTLTSAIAGALFLAGCESMDYEPLGVTVDQTQIIARGVIDQTSPDILRDAIRNRPETNILVLQNVPGSVDDISNLEIARDIRAAGFTTYIPKDGLIASGGTDLFLAGKDRKIEQGACIGVHSWAGGGPDGNKQGRDYPEDHAEHQKYLSYYSEMGIDTNFYWYTLQAADADNMHWMSDAEISQYNIGTIMPASSSLAPPPCEKR